MVNAAVRRALEAMWTDRCEVWTREEATDPDTNLTDFTEVCLLEGVPCKLSFSSLATADGDETAAIRQTVKLFLAPEHDIPAGSKVVVTREGQEPFVYARSGPAGIFHNHQEVPLELFKGWA